MAAGLMGCRRAVGLELLKPRHDAACAALQSTPAAALRDRVEFEMCDMLTAPLDGCNKFYVCNTAFPRDLNNALCASLAPSRAPSLSVLATAEELPREEAARARLSLRRVATVEQAWTPSGAPLFLYERTPDGGVGEGGAAATAGSRGGVTVDAATMAMCERRAENGRRTLADPTSRGCTEAEAERGLLRNAMLAATLAALQKQPPEG